MHARGALLSLVAGILPLAHANPNLTPAPLLFEKTGSTYTAAAFGKRIEIDAHGTRFYAGEHAIRVALRNANPRAEVNAAVRGGTQNRFIGNDPIQWERGIPLFRQVRASAVYPGIDAIYYGRDSLLEYDFILAPHAKASNIELEITGADSIALDPGGNLRIEGGGTAILQHRPVAFQMIRGRRCEVKSRYVLKSGHRVRFALGPYDHSAALTIDPATVYSSYYGGKAADEGHAAAVDAKGNFYVAGSTLSTTLGNSNVFLMKVLPAGTVVQSIFGGTTGNDTANAITVDSNGNVYLAGSTTSIDFPLGGSYIFQPGLYGSRNAFLIAFDSANTGLIFSTYIGGSYSDQALAIALGPGNNVFVAGDTTSFDFALISPNGFQFTNHGGYDGFLVSFTSIGVPLFGTYIGGSGDEHAYGVTVDSKGAAYVVGSTSSSDFPINPRGFPTSFQTTNGGATDAFALKLFLDGTLAYWSTYMGGKDADSANAIALDSSGNLYIGGATASSNFPVSKEAYQKTFQGGASDGFVVALTNGGSGKWGTFIGSEGADFINALTLDANANVILAGTTDGTTFPVTADAVQATNRGAQDAILVTLNNAGTALLSSTYYGGSGNDVATGVAIDASGHLYLSGITASSANDFPTQNAAQSKYGGGASDAFFASLGCPTGAPAVGSGGVVNDASYVGDAVSPGGVIAIFGTNLACTASAAAAIPLPVTLSGVSVKVNGTAIPLYYVSPTQINAQLPFETASGSAALTVTSPNGTSTVATVPVVPAGPGIFAANGQAAAFNQDYTLNTPAAGAKPGSVIILFFTGQGPLSQTVATGAAAPNPPPLITVALDHSATIGGVDASVAYMGAAPGLVGLAQANVTVPELQPGNYPVVLTVGGVASQPATITVSAP